MTRQMTYDLFTVRKGERLVNIGSQIPHRVLREWG